MISVDSHGFRSDYDHSKARCTYLRYTDYNNKNDFSLKGVWMKSQKKTAPQLDSIIHAEGANI